MTQYPGLEVLAAVVGIDHLAVGGARHGVDGQVPADQILFQGNGGIGVESEPAVAVATLALGARQGVFLAGFGVQENGKILAHRAEALVSELLRGATHHHPVSFLDGKAEQFVANRAAYKIDIHLLSPTL